MGLLLYFVTGAVVVLLTSRYGCKALGILDADSREVQAHSWRSYPAHHADPFCAARSLVCGVRFALSGCRGVFGDSLVFLLISYAGTIWIIGAILNRVAAM